jgi:signal transduction histidine kinase
LEQTDHLALHKPAPVPANEAARLAALQGYSILDTAVEAAFEDIVRLASIICAAPIALISLVDARRQWFKAEVGLGVRETSRQVSACAHAILEEGVFEVADTLQDARFAHSPLVHGSPHMRFYAGAPLHTPDGFALGTVCVLDTRPRELSASQREALLALSRQTMALLKLRGTLVEADSMDKRLRRIMAAAGHDLRQPLQTIAMALDIAHRTPGEQRVQASAAMGLVAVQELGSDLDELALASSPGSGGAQPELAAVPVAALFEAMRSTWQPLAQRKGLALRFAPSSLQILTAPGFINTILGNLIGNAIKYTERGTVLVGCRRSGDQVRLQVLDSGIGIEPARQLEMFEDFSKVNTRSPGLGLGLSIARRTAELLGHSLTVESIPGRGSVFTLGVQRVR